MGGYTIWYYYDSDGTREAMEYGGEVYYYLYNAQGDVLALYDNNLNIVTEYTYDSWGKVINITGSLAGTVGEINPFRYRGYYYDTETELYYLNSRYYDPETGRFINSDNQLSSNDPTGFNIFTYCGNNPINRADPTGEAWWHWAIGAAIVAACAAATIITAGGFAAGMAAVAAVSSGVAAATTASTVAAGAFVGSAMAYGVSAATAASSSRSAREFNRKGSWGTVAATAGGAILGGASGYAMSKAQTPTRPTAGRGTQNPKVKAAIQKGQEMHKQMNYGSGVLKEQTIAPGCRVDGIDFNNRIIYELKPNNPQAIARGMNQLNRYTSAAGQQFGGTWKGVLKLYD